MKVLRNFIMIFALMAMLPLQNFAQTEDQTFCFEESCVFEILENLKSEDADVVAASENTLSEMAQTAGYTHDSKMCDAMKNPLFAFTEKFSNSDKSQFLISLLPLFCTVDDVPLILKFAENERLADAAIRAVGDIDGAGGYIEKYIIKHQDNLKNKAALAYAVGKQDIKSLENELISWLKDADDNTKIEIYNALLVVRSNEKTTKIIEKGAKKLYKSKISSNKIAGMRLITTIDGEKALPLLYKSLKNKDGEVRREALELLKPFVNQEVVDIVVKKCNKDEALIDAVVWLGEIKNDSYMQLIISQLSSKDSRMVEAAIRSVFLIDNAEGINAVKPMFGGKYQDVIKESMLTYEGDYRAVLNDVMKGNNMQKLAGLQIVESRPISGINIRVRELVYSYNQEISDKAYKVLKLVVSPGNMDYLKDLMGYCKANYVEDVQLAMKNAMENATVDRKDSFVLSLKYERPEIMPRYYKVFAYFGTKLCVDKLIEAYTTGNYKDEAREALLLVEDKQFEQRIQETLK